MENTRHIESGHWPSIGSKGVASCLLLLFVTWAGGCSQPQPTTSYTTVSPTFVAAPTQVPATVKSQPTPFPFNSLLPVWSQLELPPGCLFHSLSPNLRWVVMQGCPSENGGTNWIARVDENGKLYNSRQIEGRLLPYFEGTGIMGFTPDSTRLIVEQSKTFWFINLADFTQQPYIPDTRGTSGVGYLSERWSPDGRLYLDFGCVGCQQIATVSPSDGTESIILDGVGRHGGQFTWSADGKEIAYVEGSYQESMKARMVNLQTRQSRTLVESQITLSGASCSPDGKWVVVREQQMGSSEAILWLVDPKTESKTRFAYNLSGVDALDGWRDMVWSPDGSMLALRGYTTDTRGFLVIEAPTGKPVFQGTEGASGDPLAWSADGKSLLVLDFHEQADSAIGNYILRWAPIR